MSNWDITFCSNLHCKHKECKRHQHKLAVLYRDLPMYISIADFKDCKYWEKVEEEKE